MIYFETQVVIDETPLRRRRIGFCQIDSTVRLDYDIDEERATKRHKFRPVRWWRRLDQRNNTMPRREVPQAVIDDALATARSYIKYETWPAPPGR